MSVTVDTSRLSKAIAARLQFPGRTEAQIVNTMAFYAARNAKDLTPFAPVGKIDTEIRVSASHYITKSGAVSTRKRRAFGMGDIRKDIPLVALIVNSRANPGSRVNQLEGNRYLSPQSPFKGVSREQGARLMKEAVRKLIAARHKGVKFILSGWVPAIKALYPFADKRRGGTGATASDLEYAQRGDASPATEGNWKCQAIIENATGTGSKAGQPKFNEALIKFSAPALQRAVDIEEAGAIKYMIDKTKPLNDRFNAMCK